MNINPAGLLRGLGKHISTITSSKHFPEILIGVGAGTLVGACVTAVIGTHKAEAHIREEEIDTTDKKAVVSAVWKHYVPTVVLIFAGCGLIAGGCVKNCKMRNALVTVATASEQAYSVYRAKTLEEVGEETEAKIHDEASKETKQMSVTGPKEVVRDDEAVLFKEALTGQTFYMKRSDVEWCQNQFNQTMIQGVGYGSLADWCDLLVYKGAAIEFPKAGCEMGWNIETGLLDVRITPSQTADGQRPCFDLDYRMPPSRTFDEYM